jgi:hypothetical protein
MTRSCGGNACPGAVPAAAGTAARSSLALLYGLNLQQLVDPELDHVATLAGILRLVIRDDASR